ncbi:hypothetical protein VIGAN_08261400 [Vigna angularis var. angularis]|uniref:Uncharacterized protein n=1 Tax=Vigna angularis var. angularis TaxID=157739 RepID=A0A0S3SSH7_PHAAN|nr:hypothetical protein VIGAN_08261400 [Vigna angularis var. angularis]
MKNSHPCYEFAVKRNLRSLVDRHELGKSESLSVLFYQLILRAFIESLLHIIMEMAQKIEMDPQVEKLGPTLIKPHWGAGVGSLGPKRDKDSTLLLLRTMNLNSPISWKSDSDPR